MTTPWITVAFVVAMTGATIGLGLYATRMARTASDFFVAGRSVSVFWNASAISGEYLSAASFMGIAGLLMKGGYDALWYPACYATGYLFLLLFIAGPLRRFGAYTIPDFAEGRFDSPGFRKIAVTFVLFIGFFYTMPQMKGAGVTLGAILGWPYWVGIAVVGAVITFNVAFGGMKGITFVQAFQYWAKVFAISAPVFVILALRNGAATPPTPGPDRVPTVSADTPVKFRGKADYPANSVAFSPAGPARLTFPDGARLSTIVPRTAPGLTWTPPPNDPRVIPPGGSLESAGVAPAAKVEFAEPARAVLGIGSTVPNAPKEGTWSRPFGPITAKNGYPLLTTYSIIVALVCGTAGLPHILVRFYTNPDGRAAKRTTLWVMVMLGAFYVFPQVWGMLGRRAMPQLYATNETDSLVIRLPTILSSNLLGEVLAGITAAGAFAAFMSTFSGLLVSMSGALAHDIYGKMLRPGSSPSARRRAFQFSAVAIGLASMGLGLLVESFDIAKMVGWAFAIAAASYFPLLLLGAWWPGLTKYGAAGGMLIGGFASLGAIVASMLLEKGLLRWDAPPLARALMEQPALWGVPLSVGIMVVVSLATRSSLPGDLTLKLLRLHAPEEMGLSKNYIEG